ncbi:MAG: 50S ribosomal protein L9 [Sedimentisphaerales bacterium]|nr:50S ribosomal protein L9 [Sedimentisphaerales bacterium]
MARKKPSITKVLLCEDIDGVGWLGDVVDVRTGYARNYLLPHGFAKVATEANIRSIADEKNRRADQRKSERVKLEESVKSVEGAEAVIAAKANEQGHLFGSVTEREIAANLCAQGFSVPDSAVQLTGHIKEVGTHTVKLKFAEDLSCQVNVVVVAEQSGDESEDAGS